MKSKKLTKFFQVMRDGLGLRYAFLGPFEVCHLNARDFRDYAERFFEGMPYLKIKIYMKMFFLTK